MKYIIIFLFSLSLINCHSQTKKENTTHKFTNNLIHETSPYLLQHAHNPVKWHAWNDETLALAKKENKLLLISIGYSSCHWCHVMEHESFENEDVAKVMNDNYINIKIDREERPDIDQIYMNAVQLMTGSGGWPLNCIALPDGRPLWGGTYFRKNQWVNSLTQIADLQKSNPKKLINYAEELTEGVKKSGLISLNTDKFNFNKEYIQKCINKWERYFDRNLGGMSRSPKFPMPNNYHFILRYAYQTQNSKLQKYVNTTLTKMSYGGIFDQIGGGFARYSTDKKWHIPHFEKMLYDNGQLVSLYSDAYLASKNELYKETVYSTLEFIERELMHPNNGFYSSLDADSLNEKKELEEGAFYVWKKEELQKIVPEYDLFAEYYNINSYGHWEHENYNLIRASSDKEFANKHGISTITLKQKITQWKSTLLKERSKKYRPRLDDKILTSWNALMLKGYIDAYRVFDDNHFLDIAIQNATFIKENLMKQDGQLYHNYKNKKATINGYLEDYATLINAYISLYQITFNENWLHLAKKLTDYSIAHFFDNSSKMFFFTSDKGTKLITRKIEVDDNVIPASNSIMAKNLFLLSHFYSNQKYLGMSKQMLHNMTNKMDDYASAYSNWLDLYSNFVYPFYEVAISGEYVIEKAKEINTIFIPNKLICGNKTKSVLPLLKNRHSEKETLIYVCVNNTCQLPTSSSKTAINQLKNN